jgi:hypothetical protein
MPTDWSQLGYVLIHGYAELIVPIDERHRRAVTLLRERYMQYKNMALGAVSSYHDHSQRITTWGQLPCRDITITKRSLILLRVDLQELLPGFHPPYWSVSLLILVRNDQL